MEALRPRHKLSNHYLRVMHCNPGVASNWDGNTVVSLAGQMSRTLHLPAQLRNVQLDFLAHESAEMPVADEQSGQQLEGSSCKVLAICSLACMDNLPHKTKQTSCFGLPSTRGSRSLGFGADIFLSADRRALMLFKSSFAFSSPPLVRSLSRSLSLSLSLTLSLSVCLCQ